MSAVPSNPSFGCSERKRACCASGCEERSFWGRQLDRPARHHEHAFALMMNRPWPFATRINPCLDHFQNEKVVAVHQSSVQDLAFQIRETFGNERSLDKGGGR